MLHKQTVAHISGLSDADLVEYVYTGERKYEAEAIAFAKSELAGRQIPTSQIAQLQPAILGRLTTYDAENLSEDHRRYSSSLVCDRCEIESPNTFVRYQQNIGAVYFRFKREYRGYFCKGCNRFYFWKSTLTTALLGWWGLISFFSTILYLVNNLSTFARTRSLQPLASDAKAATLTEESAERIAPHAYLITDRVLKGDDIVEIARDIAPAAGVSPVQVWCFVRRMQANGAQQKKAKRPNGFPVEMQRR